jgi:hypothetical protein
MARTGDDLCGIALGSELGRARRIKMANDRLKQNVERKRKKSLAAFLRIC